MELTSEIRESIDKSVLCWLATTSSENIPNVSPKEVFAYYPSNKIIIANIASPQSVRNISENPCVCVSFIDILVQKGFQIKGKARILSKKELEFAEMHTVLTKLTEGAFPFASITEITPETVKPILAPRYLLYPETTEEQQIESAKKLYGL